jgi:hypothetical protein
MSFQRTASPCYTFQKEKKPPIFGGEKSLRQNSYPDSVILDIKGMKTRRINWNTYPNKSAWVPVPVNNSVNSVSFWIVCEDDSSLANSHRLPAT